MSLYTEAMLAAEADGWVVECVSPLELRHAESCSFASGLAAEMVLSQYGKGAPPDNEKDPQSDRKKKWLTLLAIQQKIQHILAQPSSWDEKYKQIFCPEVSRTVFSLCHLDYYDPDTTYEDDVLAFVSAFDSKIEELRPSMLSV